MPANRLAYASIASVITTLMLGTAASAEVAAPSAPAPKADDTVIGEVVVTATKRDESLTKVPIAMNVFTAQTIQAAGITRPGQFLSRTPNVTFMEDNAGESYINIRGQTSVRNSDPNVAIVIDGVTLSSVKPFNQDLFDIQQIEVLKGPQSALYGRNAAAGAVVITTKRPTDTFEGHAVAGYGNFNSARGGVAFSGPINDTLKFAVAGSFRTTDGPFTNDTTGEKVQRFTTANGRGRLLWTPTNQLTVDFQLGGYHSTGGGSAYNAQVVGLPLGGFPGTHLDANNADMPFVSNVTGAFEEGFGDTTLKVDYDLGWATFTSISAANRLYEYFGSDSPPYVPDTGRPGATVQQYSYIDTNYSEELRLTSPADQRLRWQVGFYLLRFDRNQTSKISLDTLGSLPADRRHIEPAGSRQPTLSYSNPIYRTTSYAPFASLQFDVTHDLHLNLAGRYDTEDRSIREAAPDAVNPLTGVSYNNCVALTGSAVAQCHDGHTFTQFEPKASLSWDITPTASAYLSYGRGFKSGGFNPIGSREALIGAAVAAGLPASSVYVQNQYAKEVSTSYEAGAKVRLFDHHLALNAAIFKTKISGAQQFEFYPTVGLQTTISIDRVELKGVDADFDASLPMGVRLFGGYGYTDGKVEAFAGNPAFVGNTAPGAFKYTLNVGATKTFDLTNDLQLVPRIEYNRYGPIWWDVANTPGTRRDPIGLVSARLTLKSGSRWEVSAYGDNLGDKAYFQEVVPLLGFFTVNYRGLPRTFGLEARVNF
jgi:iron complex outermembrane receptor protein